MIWTNLILNVVCFLGFGWAIKKFFLPQVEYSAPDRPNPQMDRVRRFGLVSFFIQSAALAFPLFSFSTLKYVGTGLFVLSFTLFWWTIYTHRNRPLKIAFLDHIPNHLVTRGPYRFIRHPFYTSYFLFWIGGLIASSNPICLIGVIAMGRLYVRAARLEEEQFLQSADLRVEYQKYMDSTGRFLPKAS